MTVTENISVAENELRFSIGESSLGAILVASSHKGVRGILFGGDHDWLVRELQTAFPNATLVGIDAGQRRPC
jgi:AraC family transcriptional regulator, regulatory protein of adaptative response / methylated-DNA-[protein]-cysteine methyltransferase